MEDASLSLTRLLAAIQTGDVQAQGDVLQRYRPWLKLLARLQIDTRFQGKFSDSDIVQQTLLEACRDLPAFRGRSEPELLAWLRQILAHVLTHEIERYHGTQKRDVSLEVSLQAQLAQSSLQLATLLAAGGPSPSGEVAQRELELHLADVLADLPPDYREVIVLRNLEDLPYEVVAQRMQRTPGAVRVLWVRALAALRERVEGVY